ncbi:MAG: phosphoglucosamine mutase, partial [Gammaproteobacteria bacterium]
MAAQKFFGTDGVRGRVGAPPMTPDVLVRLGFAAGRVLGAAQDSPQVLISK